MLIQKKTTYREVSGFTSIIKTFEVGFKLSYDKT